MTRKATFLLGHEFHYPTQEVDCEILSLEYEGDLTIRLPIGYSEVAGTPGSSVEADGSQILTNIDPDKVLTA